MEREIKTFEDLDVWKICQELRIRLTGLTKKLPAEEKYRLADQIIRAARSVTNNIAEGYGRFHYKENIQFCRQSRGSLYELLDHLTICLDEHYMSAEDFEKFREDCIRAIQVLNGYIRFLRTSKNEERDV
jgi:four helix bundle protein